MSCEDFRQIVDEYFQNVLVYRFGYFAGESFQLVNKTIDQMIAYLL